MYWPSVPTVQLMSDLHLDRNRTVSWDNIIIPKSDTLIVAGDVCENSKDPGPYGGSSIMKDFADYVSKRFVKVYFVAGNHDYYGNDFNRSENKLQKIWSKNPNTKYLQCKSEVICPGWQIVGGTLWSRLPCHIPGLADFRRIIDMTPEMYNELHRSHVDFFRNEILAAKNAGMKTIVVSHHAPLMTGTSNPKYERLRRSMNHAFATDLSDIVRETDIWAFGHTHWKVSGLKCGNSELFSNPLGYGTIMKTDFESDLEECPGFDPGFLLHLNPNEDPRHRPPGYDDGGGVLLLL